jgi:carboxylate-amine ligase
MADHEPALTIGVEEEYLLVDRDSMDLAEAPEALMEACAADLEDRVSPEFLRCQIEIGTGVCHTVGEAREELRHLRSVVSKRAAEHNLIPIAAGCHPFADWKEQHHTPKERYDTLRRQMGGIARRMLICGMHVHVGIEDEATRIDLMPQVSYFLPHLLALSTSSPFWQGEDTGLASYRVSVFDNMPRTGLPPIFASWSEYERTAQVLIDLEIIEDTTKIWWDLRPSHKYPTLEARICDVCPRLEHTLSLAAAVQAVTRMLWRLRQVNQSWRRYDRFLIAENRWRAQRYGTTEGLIDFGRRQIVPVARLMEEFVAMVEEDAGVLHSVAEIEGLRAMAEAPSSTERQRKILADARAAGKDEGEAQRAVVAHLVEEFHADL